MNSESTDLTPGERFARDDAFIQSVIDAIPPKFYFDRDVLDQLEEEKIKIGNRESKGQHPRNKFGIKAKHKRMRLNPLHQKTVTQIVQELDENEKREAQKEKMESSKGNIEELQERLRMKIEAMKAERQGSTNKQAHQLKRNIAKLKQKEKNKKKRYVNVNSGMTVAASTAEETPKSPQSPAIYNKEGKLIYSKFDLGTTTISDPKHKSPKSSLRKSIMEMKKKEAKIQKLEKENTDKVEEFKNKDLWHRALNKSEGLKVKDNPELLKKTMKRLEQHKKKSQKQWQSRDEQTKKKKQERQDKRQRNIQNRKKEKLNKKLKRAAKKGRLIPGF